MRFKKELDLKKEALSNKLKIQKLTKDQLDKANYLCLCLFNVELTGRPTVRAVTQFIRTNPPEEKITEFLLKYN